MADYRTDEQEIEEVEARELEETSERHERELDYKVRVDGIGRFRHDVIAEFEPGSAAASQIRARTNGFEVEVGICCYITGTVTVRPEEDICRKISEVARDLAAQMETDSWWYNAALDDLSDQLYRHVGEYLNGFKPTGWQVYTAGELMGSLHGSAFEEGTY